MNGNLGNASMTLTEKIRDDFGDQQYKGKYYEAGMEATISIFFNRNGRAGEYSDFFRIMSIHTDTSKTPPSSRWNRNNAHWDSNRVWVWSCKLSTADSFACTTNEWHAYESKMNGRRVK